MRAARQKDGPIIPNQYANHLVDQRDQEMEDDRIYGATNSKIDPKKQERGPITNRFPVGKMLPPLK